MLLVVNRISTSFLGHVFLHALDIVTYSRGHKTLVEIELENLNFFPITFFQQVLQNTVYDKMSYLSLISYTAHMSTSDPVVSNC